MKKKYIIIIIILILLIVSVYPYIKAEVLTLKYGEKFDLDRFEMIEDISYCKVINYGEQKADVIYVCEGRISILVTYQKNSEWEVESWECIWSNSGSGDSLKWLFYR